MNPLHAIICSDIFSQRLEDLWRRLKAINLYVWIVKVGDEGIVADIRSYIEKCG